VQPALPPGSRVSEITVAPVTKPSEKAATDVQVRAASGAAKMISADETFENLKQAGFNPASVTNYVQDWFVGPLKFFKTESKRSYEQAEANWMAGLLRLESGAAISEGEKTWYKKAFFPEGGDSPEVQAQKESARRDVESVVAEVARTGNLDVSALMAAKRKVAPFTPAKPVSVSGATSAAGQTIPIQAGGGAYVAQRMPDGSTRIFLKK
jgi:hypothetical protein